MGLKIEKENLDVELDFLFKVMDNENDVTVTDGTGIILRVSNSYELNYGVTKNEILGKSVYELEEQGVFSPSVTAIVLREKRKVTIVQKNRLQQMILTTGVPIFDENSDIKYVISFNAIDIAELTSTQDKYEKMKEMLYEYQKALNDLKLKEVNTSGPELQSICMKKINHLIEQVADTEATVVITGDTGVGKSRVAKIIHMHSKRSKNPFMEINCAAIPENLIESELFGYEGGAFTGANAKGRDGKIAMAAGGTLFLDEISELPLAVQAKLLHVIQDKNVTKIGSGKSISVDFRLIAATNRNLEKDMKQGLFREDLYYRLNVIPLHIPPLKEHKEDIYPLIVLFLDRFNKKYEKNVIFSEQAISFLEIQDWPGNIRQLENLVERVVITAHDNLIGPKQLYTKFEIPEIEEYKKVKSLKSAMEEYEYTIFANIYKNHRTSVAIGKELDISQTTAARKLRKYIPGYTEK